MQLCSYMIMRRLPWRLDLSVKSVKQRILLRWNFRNFRVTMWGKSHAGKCKVRLVQHERASNTFVQSSAEQIGSQHRCQLTEWRQCSPPEVDGWLVHVWKAFRIQCKIKIKNFRQGVYQLVEYGPAVGLGTRVFAPASDFTQMDCRVLHVTYPVSRPVSFSCQV